MNKLLNNPKFVVPLAVFSVVIVGWIALKPVIKKSAKRLGGQVAAASLASVGHGAGGACGKSTVVVWFAVTGTSSITVQRIVW